MGVGLVGFGRIYRRYGQIIPSFFSHCFAVSISGGVGRFVPMVMVVERGDATDVFSLCQLLVSQSILLHCTVCQLGESVRSHLWILNKMAENHKKIVLTGKQKLELL
jgi:hypothetical protein